MGAGPAPGARGPRPPASARVPRGAASLPSSPPPSPQRRARRSWRCRAAGLNQTAGFQGGRKNGQGEVRPPRPPPFQAYGHPPAPEQRSLVQEGDATGRQLQDHASTAGEAAKAAVPAPCPGWGLPGSVGGRLRWVLGARRPPAALGSPGSPRLYLKHAFILLGTDVHSLDSQRC